MKNRLPARAWQRAQRNLRRLPLSIHTAAICALALCLMPVSAARAQEFAPSSADPGSDGNDPGAGTSPEQVVVTATRLPVPAAQSPAAITVIDESELAARQIDRVSDALDAVPGLSVAQTGTAGQLTSVFTRGLESNHTQVLLDGVPLNQGFDGAFNFADLTTDGLSRIEVQRGPQSTLYGPSALAGTIQLFTRRGDDPANAPAAQVEASVEGGSFATVRERVAFSGVLGGPAPVTIAPEGKDAPDAKAGGEAFGGLGVFDYSVAGSRLDTDNERQNNNYRNTAFIADLGFTLRGLAADGAGAPRIGLVATYSNSDTGDPDDIYDFTAINRLITERQLFAPNLDWQITPWWHHKLILDYDKEREVNNPNTGYPGPTRAQFGRYQADYQNDAQITHWLTLTSGLFYEQTFAYQRQPFVSQAYGPEPLYTDDFTENGSVFAQASLTPVKNALLVAGGRFDDFNRFGHIWTYRVAGSYLVEKTGTTLRSSVATGFSPPTAQDRIFGNNLNLDPERDFGYDAGFEQGLFKNKLRFGANYFHNDLSNVIGYTTNFLELENLGRARTLGIEAFARWEPAPWLFLRANYTWLDAVSTGDRTPSLPEGTRLPRQPRNQVFAAMGVNPIRAFTMSLEVNTVNAREDIDPQTFLQVNAPDYTVLRLLADYNINAHLRLYGRVENLTNANYMPVLGYPALGRGFFGGMAVRF